MTLPRSTLIDDDRPGCYHIISRCVRRAYLCGDGCEHRKQWLLDRIEAMAQAFAVEVLAVAVMSNHLHLVVKNRPDRTSDWQPEEVAERWATVFPRRDAEQEPLPPDQEQLAIWAADPVWVERHRQRLGSPMELH